MNEEIALEVLPPSALESIERASIDVQVSTAHRFPRSLALFKKRAMDMVQQDLQTAESCVYVRPVGKGEDGKQKYAEGASIRMAEIVAACYGNIRFGARIIEQTERYVKAEGVAHDLESNTAGKSEAMESTVKRNGQPYDERMRIVVAKAALSKALRDSIFRVVPRALCKSVYDAAKGVIAGQQKTLEQRRKAVQAWLATIKVDDARTFGALGVKGWSEVGEDQLLTLTGLKTGIKDNELTIAEAFPPVGEGTAKLADLSDLSSVPAGTGATTAFPSIKRSLDQLEVPPGLREKPPASPVAPLAAIPIASDAKDAPAPATAPGQATGEAPATCKYCGQPVIDMAAHSCEPMQEALKAAHASGFGSPMEHLSALMERDNVSLDALLQFTLVNRLRKDKQKIGELSGQKLQNLVASWATILPELQKLSQPAA